MRLISRKRLGNYLFFGLFFLIASCSQATAVITEQATDVTQTPAITVFVTQVVATPLPATATRPPTATPLPVPTQFDPNDPINAEIYYPLPGCSASRLHVDDLAFVAATGDKVRLHISQDILYDPGMRPLERDEVLLITRGPFCNEGWLIWEVLVQETEEVGFVPEGDGNQYWLLPLPE
jgi:hypothetical protein